MTKLLPSKKILPFLLLFFIHTAYSQTISAIAGIGKQGYSGDNSSAGNAMLNSPWGLAIDHSGNMYIADYANSRIRKINASNGVISTIAGTGVNGYNGDGIDAINAQLNAPMGVAVDASGNIYIADDGNYRVRKITVATGKISTVAGTGVQGFSGDGMPATSAKLGDPWHITFDADDNMYITDYSNNRIRKVDASNGIITTVAGNGIRDYYGDDRPATAAALNLPVATAIDSYGNIYIADFNNNSIRKVTASTGIISTIAGDGDYGYNTDGIKAVYATLAYPGGVAVDDSGNVYLTDSDNSRIRKINASDGIISTIAGNGTSGDSTLATNATLNYPQAITLSSGNLYFTDTYSGQIRKISNVYTEVPLKFVSLTGLIKKQQVALQWQTNKTTSHYFNVQYSTDKANWSTIETVAAKDSISLNSYLYNVALPNEAVNYYRLIAINKYNDTIYSEAQKIDVVLPVSFISFTTDTKQQHVLLQWQVNDNGNNNHHFNLQYSTDKVSWSIIKSVQAIDSTSRNTYHSTITEPTEPINYYRLIAVNKYNDTIYSEVQCIRVTIEKDEVNQNPVISVSSLSVYPNPILSTNFTINIGQPVNSKIDFVIIDLMGRTVQTGIIVSQLQDITTNNLPAGIYILKLSDGRTIKIKKR